MFLNKRILFLITGLLCLSGPVAWGEKRLKNLDEPVIVQLKTDLGIGASKQGDPFAAVLTENYRYPEGEIPAGTVFEGEVQKISQSQPFTRPGYALLDVQKAVLPNGAVYTFKQNQDPPVLHHPKAVTFKKWVLGAVPFAAVATATSLSLSLGSSLSVLATEPISLGMRMLTGTGIELGRKVPGDNRSTAHKIAAGMYDGTGIPGAVSFFTKSPNPSFKTGDNIPLNLDTQGLHGLLSVNRQSALANSQ